MTGVNGILGTFQTDADAFLVPSCKDSTSTPTLTPAGITLVNSTADNDLHGRNLATFTLQEAIIAFNRTDNSFGGCEIEDNTIDFETSLSVQMIWVVNFALPAITENVTIPGLKKDHLFLSGDNPFRVFEIVDAASPVVTFPDLTITQGRATYGKGDGILRNTQGLLTLDSVTSNTATGTGETGRGEV